MGARPIVIAGRVLGSLGMITLLSSILTYALTREIGWMIYTKLGFGAAAVLFYFLTNAGDLMRFFGAKSTVYSTTSIASIGGFLVLITAANFIGVTYNREIDLTKEQIFSLSEQTSGVLERLNQDIEFLAFYRPEDPERGAIQEQLERYMAKSTHVALTFVNPEKDPEIAKEYGITQDGPRIVVKAGEHKIKIREGSEEELTNAIVRAAQQSSKSIVFLTGHGEADPASPAAEGYKDAAQALKDEGYTVGTVSLFDKNSVPEDIGALVIAAPKRELLSPEVEMVRGYMLKGGRVLIMLEPADDGGLTGLLADWSLALGDDLVVDANPVSQAFGFGPEMPVIQKLEKHAITGNMKSSIILPTARSVGPLDSGGETKTAAVLKTSAESWAEKSYRERSSMAKDADDTPGPIPVMAVATKTVKMLGGISDQTRIVVVGDHELANNRFLPVLGNRDLFLNAVNWLVQEEERISIRPRSRGASRLFITEAEANFVKFFSIDIVPMLLLAVGVAVWQVRRRK